MKIKIIDSHMVGEDYEKKGQNASCLKFSLSKMTWSNESQREPKSSQDLEDQDRTLIEPLDW